VSLDFLPLGDISCDQMEMTLLSSPQPFQVRCLNEAFRKHIFKIAGYLLYLN